jgi:hypothetical protein
MKEIEYFSPYPKNDIGGIPFKYFPYRNQPGYLSPLVFVHFKNITQNLLINVICKGYAKNIDNKDRRNQRGMVKFQLYVESESSSGSGGGKPTKQTPTKNETIVTTQAENVNTAVTDANTVATTDAKITTNAPTEKN